MVHTVTTGLEMLDNTLRLRLYSVDVRVTEEMEMIWN
jgi:hypothetical protein